MSPFLRMCLIFLDFLLIVRVERDALGKNLVDQFQNLSSLQRISPGRQLTLDQIDNINVNARVGASKDAEEPWRQLREEIGG